MDDLTRADRGRLQPVPLASVADRDRPRASLPASLTRFIGREREVAAVTDLLLGDVRLVTLTGPGGVGKTRLALRVAGNLEDVYSDGVAVVALASVASPELVGPAVANAVGVRPGIDRPLVDRLAAALAERHLLLVLDNFEHLLTAAPFVVDLLAACPRLTVLATSRETLHLSGEHAIVIQPLALPDATQPASASVIAGTEAVRLFVARAKAARSDFTLTEQNAETVAEICRRLEGLPLAIELAAARVTHLPPAALLQRLGRRLALLTGGARDLPARQRTMRDVIAWSHDLLSPDEQALLRRLAVFVSGCSLEAAESVTATSGDLNFDVLGVVASLVAKSLLRQEIDADGQARYWMLETVREFGLERLVASGEEDATRGAHARYFLALAERSEPDIYRGRDLIRLLGALETEHANLQAALAHLTATGATEAALRLAGALAPFWLFHSHRDEGCDLLERTLAQASIGETSASTRATALGGAATLTFTRGDYDRAAELARENLALRQQLADRHGIATALNLLGAVMRARGNFDQAASCFDEALTVFEEIGDPGWMALTRGNLGILAFWRGDLTLAASLLDEAVGLYRQDGDRHPYGVAAALSDLALVTCDQGDYARAAALFAESLARWRAVGTKEGLVDWLARVAVLAAARGQSERAARLFGAAEALREVVGYAFERPERARHECAMAASRTGVGEVAFATAWTAGVGMSPDEAAAEASQLVMDLSAPGGTAPEGPGLTPRELDVLRLIVEGRSDKEIAEALFVSRGTASKHVASILAKLDAPRRGAAAARAVHRGLI